MTDSSSVPTSQPSFEDLAKEIGWKKKELFIAIDTRHGDYGGSPDNPGFLLSVGTNEQGNVELLQYDLSDRPPEDAIPSRGWHFAGFRRGKRSHGSFASFTVAGNSIPDHVLTSSSPTSDLVVFHSHGAYLIIDTAYERHIEIHLAVKHKNDDDNVIPYHLTRLADHLPKSLLREHYGANDSQ